MQWLNEPTTWTETDERITVQANGDTDFWRVTRHDFIKDDGHFYYQQVTGNFTTTAKVTGEYATLYDQAGLMVRLDETVWLKCGVEFVEGQQWVSAVVTRDYSDWSFAPLDDNPASLWIQVERTGSACEVRYSLDGQHYTAIRDGYLSDTPSLMVGVMVAAPKGKGFSTVFEGFSVVQHAG
jgi:uncharacterized protein